MQTKSQPLGYKPLLETLNAMGEDISGIQLITLPDNILQDFEDPHIKVELHIKTKEAYRKWVCDKGSIIYHTRGLKMYKHTIDYRSITLKYYPL